MYDVVVIGGGPGGYAAAIRSAQLGGSVALLEPGDLGGTCVNRGCIPTKIWLKAARLKKMVENGGGFGIKSRLEAVDLEEIVARKQGVPNDIKMGMAGLCANNGIELIPERGVIKGPNEVDIGGKVLETRSIIIATGSSIASPDIPNLADAALTTDQAVELTSMPGSILICGGGPIEIEMAAILNAFGCKVTLVTDAPRILPGEDGDTGQRISQILRNEGVEILPRFSLSSVQKVKAGFSATIAGKEDKTIEVDRILVSGRMPNTDIGLDQADVRCTAEGFIEVNDSCRTSSDSIYAIGDVTGGWMLSYAATTMGVTAAENAMGGSRIFDSKTVPRALYTTPEAASVGLTEEEADELDIDYETGSCPMSINGVAMAYGELEGNVKVVFSPEYGDVLGIHIVGEHATEMIWGAATALRMEAVVEDLAYTQAMHPTFSENIAMAAQDSMQWALYLPKK